MRDEAAIYEMLRIKGERPDICAFQREMTGGGGGVRVSARSRVSLLESAHEQIGGGKGEKLTGNIFLSTQLRGFEGGRTIWGILAIIVIADEWQCLSGWFIQD